MTIADLVRDYRAGRHIHVDFEGEPSWTYPYWFVRSSLRDLTATLLCRWRGHDFEEEAADAENGISTVTCSRCGEYHTFTW